MKRKMVHIGIFWMLGLFFASFFSWPWCLLLSGAVVPGLICCCIWKICRISVGITAGCSLLAGLVLFWSYTMLAVQPVLQYDGAETTFTGKIVSIHPNRDDHASYLLKGTFPDGLEAKVFVYAEDLGGVYGDRLTVTGTFSKPENTDLFASKQYWYGEGVFLTSLDIQECQLEQKDGYWLTRRIAEVRQQLQHRFYRFAGTEAGGMMSAMLLGEKQNLEESVRSSFYAVGIGHILAVSGLHLVLLMQVWMVVAKRLHRYLQVGGSVCGIVLFALLVQTPVSILRAGFMMLLGQCGRLVFRQTDTLNSLCLAVLLLTIQNPYLLLNQSFLFTVSGTFGIGVLGPWAAGHFSGTTWKQILVRECLQNICVTACLFPASVACGTETSLLSPLVNLFLLPLCMVILMGALLLAFIGWIGWLAVPLAAGCKLLCHVVIVCVQTVQRFLPVSTVLSWRELPILTGICVVGILFLYGLLRNRKQTALAVAGSMLLLTGAQFAHQLLLRKQITVAVLGTQKSYVLVISDSFETVVIDPTGNRKNPDYVKRYLREMGITQIQMLCLMEKPSSSCGSYAEGLQSYTVQSVLLGSSCALRKEQKVCRQVPTVRRQSQTTLAVPSGTISLQESFVQLQLDGIRMCIAADSEAVPEQDWDYVVVGSLQAEHLPQCNWLAILEETDLLQEDATTVIGTNNLQISLQQSKVRRLAWQE